MAKTTSKPPRTSSQKDAADEVTRLDERLYQLSIKTAKSIQRFRITILSIISLIALAIFGVWGVNQYKDLQDKQVSASLADLLEKNDDGESNLVEALPQLEELIRSSAGKPRERWVVKKTVTALITDARGTNLSH